MEARPDRYYRDSGAVPFKGTALMLLGGIAGSLVVSFVYALIARYNPFIYVTFLATIFFGGIVGMIVNKCAHWGAVRNKMFLTLVGMVIGLLAIYFAWMWYVFIFFGWNPATIVLDPSLMLKIIQAFGENGIWSIKNATPTGWSLYSLWIIEAAIVVVASTLVAVGESPPYCEACRRWTDAVEQKLKLAVADTNEIRQSLENENYEVLDKLAAEKYEPNSYYHALIHRCGGCDQSTYLTISSVNVTLDEGERKENATALIKCVAIPDDLVPHVVSLVAAQEEREKTMSASSLAMGKHPLPTPAAPSEPAMPATEDAT